MRSRALFAGLVLQAVVVAVIASSSAALSWCRSTCCCRRVVPLQLTPARFIFTVVLLVVAAVLGSAISLRRVPRIDPASAIGSAS